MIKIYLFVLGALILPFTSFSQKKNLTIEDALVNNRGSLAAQNLRGLQFIQGSNDYAYIKNVNGEQMWVRSSFNQKEDMPFLTLRQINDNLLSAKLDTFKTLPTLKFEEEGYVMSMKGGRYQYNLNSKTIRQLRGDRYRTNINFEESKAGYLAYLKNDNLFVGNYDSLKQITNDGSKDIVYASSVHQSEFGITKGIFWSPSGKILAFYRMDQHMIPDYPIIDWSKIPAKNINIKYPMAGDSSHHVTVGVYNPVTDKLLYLQSGLPAEQYLTNVAWSPDDKYIFIAVVNRAQNHMWLRQYNAEDGAYMKTLFEEEDSKYTEPLVPMLFIKNNPDQFIWQSRKDGYTHLYLYNVKGEEIRQLTRGNWEVTEVKDFDEKGENLFYTSTEQSPLSRDLYQLNIKKGKSVKVSTGVGLHATTLSDDNRFVLDNFSNATTARTIKLINLKTKKEKILLESENPLEAYNTGVMNIFTIKSRSGEQLYCRQYLPVDFDSTKKYPVIFYWYGGPHAQIITAGFNGGSSDYWFQYLAERGYIVMSLDTRGSSNRGKQFEQSIFRKAGAVQMQDMETFLDYLKRFSYLDRSKMGLFGWSYGGFMTTDFVLNHPGTFKAAVAGGPVMNWREYEIMYGERYMDTPQENPEGYAATNLTLKAAQLKDKLLLIHGLQDPVVLQQHSVDFVKACVDAGVQVDYMIYPGHEHNVLGKDRAHLYQKVTDYFDLYLKSN